MYRRHEGGRKRQQWMGGILILAIVLCASVVPGHARRGGGHGFHGGHRSSGHSFHGGHRGGGHGFHGGHGWRGHGHYGKHSWGGVGVSIGVGSYWWPYGYPYVGSYWWPYSYPSGYPYTYSPQISVQPAQPLSLQPPASPPVWYYCDNPAGYYPYVQQCPGGWRTVPPSPQ